VPAALGATDDVDRRIGQVAQAARAVSTLLTFWLILATGAHRGDLDAVDLDVDTLSLSGGDLDRGGRPGLALGVGAEGSMHQAVYADLRAQVAVGSSPATVNNETSSMPASSSPLLVVDDSVL
jgi:hypothetical protein